MIWGKTYATGYYFYEEKEAVRYRRWFAWRPTWLQDGRWVWLETVMYVEIINGDHSYYFYRPIQENNYASMS